MSKTNEDFIFFYKGKGYSSNHYTILLRYYSEEDLSTREICFVKTSDGNYFNISFKIDGTRSRIECCSREKFIEQLKEKADLFPGGVNISAMELIEV